jgi:hypothetical protein
LTGGFVVKVRALAQAGSPAESFPQTWYRYWVPAASPFTFAVKGPLAPAGQLSLGVLRGSPTRPFSSYSNQLSAGPSFAVPPALSVALSMPTSVAGSVEA